MLAVLLLGVPSTETLIVIVGLVPAIIAFRVYMRTVRGEWEVERFSVVNEARRTLTTQLTTIVALGTLLFAALDYRVDSSIWSVFTMGGLHTGVDGEVFTPDGDRVAGLYAAGRTTSGLAAQGYSSGLSLADATFFGRRAGRVAARAAGRTNGERS